jgi:hypothetical protein
MTRGMPAKGLALLTAAVIAAHLAVLQAGTLALPTLAPSTAEPARPFVTRTVASPLASAITPVAQPAAVKSISRLKRPTPPAAAPVVALAELEAPQIPLPQVVTDTPPEVTPDDVALAEAPPAATPEPAPPPFSAATVPSAALLRYEVASNKLPFTVNGIFNWRQDGSAYEAQLSYSAFGFSRSQTSRGAVSSTGLAPERFADKVRNEVAAHFNYADQKVTFSANTPDVALLNGAQDRLSVLVQLGAQMAAAPERYPEGTTLSFQTIGPRDAATWLFTVQGQETLTLPGGELPTIKLIRNPRQDYDQKVELWLAPALGYLPARIRITEQNGDAIDQKWLATELPS